MIQLVCLNGEVFADHDGDTDVPLAAYPAGCRVVPWSKSLGALPLIGPPPPVPEPGEAGEPDMRHTRKAPVLTEPDDLLAYAASARYYRMIAGVTVDGTLFGTDDASEAKLQAKATVFDADPKGTIAWKARNGFVTLDSSAYTKAVREVAAYRESCFAAEEKADAGIRDGSIATMEQVDAVIAPPATTKA